MDIERPVVAILAVAEAVQRDEFPWRRGVAQGSILLPPRILAGGDQRQRHSTVVCVTTSVVRISGVGRTVNERTKFDVLTQTHSNRPGHNNN